MPRDLNGALYEARLLRAQAVQGGATWLSRPGIRLGLSPEAGAHVLIVDIHRHILVEPPMKINTDYLDRSIETLEGFGLLRQHEPDEIAYRISRSACVEEFEIIEELSGSLLKKRIRVYFASNREADRLYFRDIFHHAARHGLIAGDECERWLQHRDYCNNAAHRYGEEYADEVLATLPRFIEDARSLPRVMAQET